MANTSPQRVTLDTNVCNIIHDPDTIPQVMDPADVRKLRQAIVDRKVQAFVSEATLFIECLSFEDKLTYLSVATTKNPRPAPDPRRIAVFTDLGSIGVKLLHAPLIGAEIFIPGLVWADDEVYSADERHIRFGSFICGYARHDPIRKIGQKLLTGQAPVPAGRRTQTGPDSFSVETPQDWAIAIKREWDSQDDAGRKTLRKQIGPLIAEWCDTLIVGSHFAYGNDILCTADEGKNAGSGSVLFHGNRASLRQQGISIRSPTDFLKIVS